MPGTDATKAQDATVSYLRLHPRSSTNHAERDGWWKWRTVSYPSNSATVCANI
jgi:hypothetical protein